MKKLTVFLFCLAAVACDSVGVETAAIEETGVIETTLPDTEETSTDTTTISDTTAPADTTIPAETVHQVQPLAAPDEPEPTTTTEPAEKATEATPRVGEDGSTETIQPIEPLVDTGETTPELDSQGTKKWTRDGDNYICHTSGLDIEVDAEAGTFTIPGVGVDGDLENGEVPDKYLEAFCGLGSDE